MRPYENLAADAVRAVQQNRYTGYDTLKQVADAAIETHSDWVINISRQHAEEIMDAGKSSRYHHALDWLKRAKAAYLASQRQTEWQTYRSSLLTKHARKRSLVPGLKGLR